ncbi:hypothetical protein N7474_006396 [Penicillium riverlandense]|uniref:uncharacterized protein n=1 Tax=Penicillium riverlandense TaxID=1903569 RepID=UPI002549B5C7|nr:uncharacterized protein N7474_006396 [Penicillium riverlandense]KAJ5814619.1 hypothetical protein N7474_006396 [Penicillium riverlandense]
MADDLADSMRLWRYASELLGSSSSTDDLHDRHAPRSTKGFTGALSLHDYRKSLSQSHERVGDLVDRGAGRTLKRKPRALNLNLNKSTPALSSLSSYPVSVSSATSSPPPLSPSYSHSVVSQRSEQDSEVFDSIPAPRVTLVSDNSARPRPNNRKRVNTFREKRQSIAHAPARHSPLAQEDPKMLAHTTQASATISLGGASFEILNPRKSLDVARIVSFIEDVDGCSMFSDNRRDSRISSTAFSLEQGLDRISLSQFTDASLPSHYSSQSLYSSLPGLYPMPRSPLTGNDRIRSLSEYSTDFQQADLTSPPLDDDNHVHYYEHDQINHDLLSDSAHNSNTHMASIPERYNEIREPCSSSSQPSLYSEGSDIGEPGSPVYANGEWAQVNERDRGIFFDLPQPAISPAISPSSTVPPTPAHSDTYRPFPSSSYASLYDPYDPVFLDPHIREVLAAATAENMGLRASGPARALDDLQRRSRDPWSGQSGSRRSSERKSSFSQRVGFRKFFSWRGGN